MPQPQAPGNEFARSFTDAHNRSRQTVKVAPLRWSAALATMAQDWADQLMRDNCRMRHSPANGYGENLAWSGGASKTPAQVVAMWVGEQGSYSYSTNRCQRGESCGHYTQVVWADTRELGCGFASCGNSEVWVCNYFPPGNFVGQRPY